MWSLWARKKVITLNEWYKNNWCFLFSNLKWMRLLIFDHIKRLRALKLHAFAGYDCLILSKISIGKNKWLKEISLDLTILALTDTGSYKYWFLPIPDLTKTGSYRDWFLPRLVLTDTGSYRYWFLPIQVLTDTGSHRYWFLPDSVLSDLVFSDFVFSDSFVLSAIPFSFKYLYEEFPCIKTDQTLFCNIWPFFFSKSTISRLNRFVIYWVENSPENLLQTKT